MMKNKVWIARDGDNRLYLYSGKEPTRDLKSKMFQSASIHQSVIELKISNFPDVVFDNSPQLKGVNAQEIIDGI